MFAFDQLLFVGAILLLAAVASSKISARLGVPVLVVFVALGMLAGSEGIGGIAFENYALANALGTVALVLILFDGGLRTSRATLRRALAPALTLATAGVLLTALLTGVAAARILHLPLLDGLLIGSVLSSTDAAAVFTVLRARGVAVRERLAATLEVESGANDPMAVFLTVGLLHVVLGRATLGADLAVAFASQMVIGAGVGLGVGYGAAAAVNRVNLDAAGLYPVLTGAAALLAYGLAAILGGSGFLSVYLAGIVMGNRRLAFQRGILLFHDGLAWVSQIAMFVVLGLLSFPSRLASVAGAGFAIAAFLALVARPLAVAALLAPFRFSTREVAFVAWVGLRGAVPIILATFPLLLGHPRGALFFDVAFFAVMVSALAQGWSLPLVARWLGVDVPAPKGPPVVLEITAMKHAGGDIVEYGVTDDSRAANHRVRELALPEDAVIAMIVRGDRLIPPRGSSHIRPGDYVFLVLAPQTRALVDRLFSAAPAAAGSLPHAIEFPLSPTTTVGELHEFYGIDIDARPDMTVAELLRDRLGDPLQEGSVLVVGDLALYAREVADGAPARVGVAVLAPRRPDAP